MNERLMQRLQLEASIHKFLSKTWTADRLRKAYERRR
jgi:hypothetical protein